MRVVRAPLAVQRASDYTDSMVIFRPTGIQPSHYRQIALIALVFFIFVQVAFLEGAAARVAFAVAFAVFMVAGVLLSLRVAKTWPQEITMTESGISYTSLGSRHGVDLVPWQEIEKMDLFYNHPKVAPFLRIGLRKGNFRNGLVKPIWQEFSRGLDVNIPVAVDADPKVVLETARRLWKSSRPG